MIDHKAYLAHRLAWLYVHGVWPKETIDHKNRIRHDNRWTNLRAASGSQNNINSGMFSTNTSGYRGVTYAKKSGKWRAQIKKKGINYYLGEYQTKEEAIIARFKKEREFFPKFYNKQRLENGEDTSSSD